MRQNSRTGNQDFGSSYQKSSYKIYKPKPKGHTAERWDHSGFNQLELEEQHQYTKPTKARDSYTEVILPAAKIETLSIKTGQELEKLKNQQNANNQAAAEDNGATTKVTSQVAKPRRERRPDRQLYNVRQKCGMRNEEMKRKQDMSENASERLNCSLIEKREDISPCQEAVKEVLAAFGEKELDLLEDDRFSVSNVSTAISERHKNCEEESSTKSELIKEEADSNDNVQQQSLPVQKGLDVLFDIFLESSVGILNVRIFQGEDDYENLLEKVCDANNFEARTKLYFMINVLQYLQAMAVDSVKVDPALNKLLDINYKVLMYESGLGEADESIASYI